MYLERTSDEADVRRLGDSREAAKGNSRDRQVVENVTRRRRGPKDRHSAKAIPII